jgi:uncharacterized protein YbjT (DUF2867 family)
MRLAIIGATGLVGSRLVPLLGQHEVLLLGRRPAVFAGVAEKVAPADEWPALLAGERIDSAVSALGSTWRKAGSWERFEAVDRHAVVAFARAARECGARQFVSVSSAGADPSSGIEYLALKGRVEADLQALGFDRLDLLRPGLLRGPRGGDRRLKERIGIALSPITNLFVPDRFAAIEAATVAGAIAALLGARGESVFVHENREIRSLASA